MKIVIGSDEQGMKLKEPIKEYLLKRVLKWLTKVKPLRLILSNQH